MHIKMIMDFMILKQLKKCSNLKKWMFQNIGNMNNLNYKNMKMQ